MYTAGRIIRINFRATLLATTIFSFLILTILHLQIYQLKDYSNTTPSSVAFLATSQPFIRHVTKSMAELGPMDELNPNILFLNSIPKSGSELLVLLLQWLQGWNNFRHIRLKGSEKKLIRDQQEEFIEEVVGVIKNKAIPLTFDRQVYFVNFTNFNPQSPTYINLIRDPIDMVLSRFQHLMTTKNLNTNERRIVEKCIKQRNAECSYIDSSFYDLAIPYFCGQHSHCMLFNDETALKSAKNNVERYFPVVGILEELNTTLAVFEGRLPYFFKGVQRLYYKDLLQHHQKKYRKTIKVPNVARKNLKTILRTEYEFYEWVKQRLFEQLKILGGEHHPH